jgi:two-component system nitrogen regulation response regulator NtrX
MASDILIVDDEADIRDLVAGILDDEGHGTRTAGDADMALASIEERRPSLLFLDIWLQGSRLDGMQLLEMIKGEHPDLPIVMISGHGTIDTAVAAIKKGAFDFIEKPFKADRLVLVAERALETSSLKRQVEELRQRSGDSSELVGSSATMSQFRNMLERIAPTNSRILLHGPSGCGKELAARTIHQLSSREKGPFVALNAAAITPETMEIELFGTESEPGQPRKIGALEAAHGGTLYLDEVADMPRDTQNKIMRVLIDQNFSRVGGATRVNVDVRIISSTARNMEMMVADGHFRSDLYHRLAVVPVRVPALSEHRDDIPELVGFFMKQISQSTGLPIRKIGDEAMAVLQSHDWPGNIRQLRNNIERLMILTRGDEEAEITSELLPSEVGMQVPKITSGGGEHLMSMPLRDAREIFERDYLTAQINRFGGNISRTAEFIGMERSALHRKLKALGIG